MSASSPLPAQFGRVSNIYEFAPAQQVDEAVKKQLAEDAVWAADLIEKLVTDGGDEAMKPGIINACEGLAFVHAAKGGFGLTVARGRGFVMQKLDQDPRGQSRWGPPVYFNVSQMGLGLSAGYESSDSCLALLSLSSVHRFCSDRSAVGTDLGTFTTEGGMSGVPAGAFGRQSHMDVTADHERSCFAYSISSGLLANVSINGNSTYPNKEFNAKLYGNNAVLEDVLAGKVPTFSEFLPLYRKIQDLGVRALSG